jgi:UDP-N-acetylglucosamine 3-dehydrogenase
MRIAILGAGWPGSGLGRIAASISDVEVTWVADEVLEKAQEDASKHGARATARFDVAIAAADVDAVVITTALAKRRELTELAALRGKHVLCSGCLARNVDDAKAMDTACRKSRVRLMTGGAHRFDQRTIRIGEAIQADAIGRIGVIRYSVVGKPARELKESDPDADVIFDDMLGPLDLLRSWFGEVARVSAIGPRDEAERRGYAQALLRFEDGKIAHLDASWLHTFGRIVIELAGVHGILRVDSETSTAFRFETPAQPNGTTTVPMKWLSRADPWQSRRAQLRHFVDRIEDGGRFAIEAEEGIAAIELGLAIAESIRTSEPVNLAENAPVFGEAAR